MIVIVHDHIERGRIRHAVFDFDGTLSLIREGWQRIMLPLMIERLLQTPNHESEAELNPIVTDLIARTTGKETIFQMMDLAEQIHVRGGQPADPLVYKHEYLTRLWEHIQHRVLGLKTGRIPPDEMMVPGARAMLQALCVRGVRCYLASGTDHPAVLDEAAALQITPYFCGIYGAHDDYKRFSKRMLVEQIMAENRLQGCELVAFGDGSVETQETKRVGGIAVGVASNEATRAGTDNWKRDRLIQAGADIIVPDFRDHVALVHYLFDREPLG